jgi:hypothetical protein
MKWRCFFLRRRFVPYLEGEIPPRQARHLEKHLADCPECESLFQSVRAGHQAGQQFARLGPDLRQRPPEFEELWTRVGARLDPDVLRSETGRRILGPLSTRFPVQVLVILALALSVFLVMSNRKISWRPAERAAMSADEGRFRKFTPLRIAEFAPDIKSAVVTEGFVDGVYFDEEERTLHIKLVEIQEKPEPYVICEILNPARMSIPQEGSRVRVYGMARYDPQPGRGWNEVNPVTDIDILKR